MHIGLIGGIGPAATEFYYRGLVARYAGAAKPMELTIVHADARELSQNAAVGDAQKQAQIFLALVRRLASAGAQTAAITSIGGHFCVQELSALSPIPIFNAIPEIAERIQQKELKTVGLLGTSRVMKTRLYGGISSASVVVPEDDALDKVHRTYVAMALSGKVTDEQRGELFSIGQSLCRDQGAEVVLLAGTDLFLAFDGRACGFPFMDCAEIHMDALGRRSIKFFIDDFGFGGHELTRRDVRAESVEPSSVDMRWTGWHVSFVPFPDSCIAATMPATRSPYRRAAR